MYEDGIFGGSVDNWQITQKSPTTDMTELRGLVGVAFRKDVKEIGIK